MGKQQLPVDKGWYLNYLPELVQVVQRHEATDVFLRILAGWARTEAYRKHLAFRCFVEALWRELRK